MPPLDTRMDKCSLKIISNDIHREDSRRTKIYFIIKNNPNITIENIFYTVKDKISMAEVRSDVRSLFADGKIDIEGWKVDTPRTMKFTQISRN